MVQYILKYNIKQLLYYFKSRVLAVKQFEYNKQLLNQLKTMFICYSAIYDMTMLSRISYMKILIEWKYPVYPDSILKEQCCHFGLRFKILPTQHILVSQNTIDIVSLVFTQRSLPQWLHFESIWIW
jgi:hypothetical protein